jgi:hypothetical protein
MPRGEDTSKHPFRGVHRTTPRIARMIEDHLNQQIEDSTEHLFGHQPLLGYTMAGQPTYVNRGQGQNIVNRYRELRDAPPSDTPFGREVRRERVSDESDAIADAIRTRREEYGE